MQNPTPNKNPTNAKSKPKTRCSKRQRNRRRNKQKSLNSNQNKAFIHSFCSRTAQRDDAEIWREAYDNAVRWHSEHQGNFWRRAAENLQRENQMLRQQLQVNRTTSNNLKPDVHYETSSDEDEPEQKVLSAEKEKSSEKDDQVDLEYLEFLQITIKHREELRLKREAEVDEVPPHSPQTLAVEDPILG